MRDPAVAIIGGGPRGLTLLEQLGRAARTEPALARMRIDLVDPGIPGEGCHPSCQPADLLTNTLASQVSAFGAVDPDRPEGGSTGPSFTEWARAEGYRRRGTAYGRDPRGEPVGDLDYLPRALLGEYLAFAWRRIVAGLPPGMHVAAHRTRAVDVVPEPLEVRLESGVSIWADHVVIATGHGEARPDASDLEREAFVAEHRGRNPRLGYVPQVYPVERLAFVRPDATVAVQGLGLTAYDVIAALTTGRGGRYEEGGDGALSYRSSGKEPRIRLFSRLSLPSAARGVNQKGLTGAHEARFLTPGAIRALRERRAASGRGAALDFERHVMPLLVLEMAYAHRCAREGRLTDPARFVPTEAERDLVAGILDPRDLLGRPSLEAFRAGVLAFLREDLAEARRGNVTSPLKAATDAIRDIRAGLVEAIEDRGLTPESHRYVIERFVPTTNRITFGPPLRRNAELIALLEAGIVDWAGGPGAAVVLDPERPGFAVETRFPGGTSRVPADVLVKARVAPYRPEEDLSPLSGNLLRRGLVRPFRNGPYHPCGIDLDRDAHPIRADGRPWARAWVLGFPAEGPRFHTHALPRPGRRSTQVSDAVAVARGIAEAARDAREPPAEPRRALTLAR